MKPEAPRHIAIMLPRFSRYGGVEQFGYRISEALASRGHKVDFICSRQEIEAPKGVQVIPIGRYGGVKVLKMLWFLIRAERQRRKKNYDLVLSLGKTWHQDLIRVGGGPLLNFWKKSEKAIPKGYKRNIKRLSRLVSPANWLTLLIEKHQYNEKTQIIAVSHLVKDWLLKEHPKLNPDNVEVIYNLPNTSRFHPLPSEERKKLRKKLWSSYARGGEKNLELDLDKLNFLGTATTNFQLKGIGPLIRSLEKLPENTHFFVAGGRGSSDYMALAKELGLEARVHFCGKIEDMPSFYQGLDLFVLASFYDACSNAVLEARASGCRVLSSVHNGSSYFLDKKTLIQDPGDPEELALLINHSLHEERPAEVDWPVDQKSGITAFAQSIEDKMP